MAPKKTSKGKQKIEMKKIERQKDLYVAFTKRKMGIFNKASELSTLCGAFVDILIFSPRGKPFCYGEPSFKSLARTTLEEEIPSLENEMKKLKINERNMQNDEVMDATHVQEAHREYLKTLNTSGWWSFEDEDLQNYDLDETKKLHAKIDDVALKILNNILRRGGEIDPRAIPTCILNGGDSNPTHVSGGGDSNPTHVSRARNEESEIVAGHGSNKIPNDPKGKGKAIIVDNDPTNETQRLKNPFGASGSGCKKGPIDEIDENGYLIAPMSPHHGFGDGHF